MTDTERLNTLRGIVAEIDAAMRGKETIDSKMYLLGVGFAKMSQVVKKEH